MPPLCAPRLGAPWHYPPDPALSLPCCSKRDVLPHVSTESNAGIVCEPSQFRGVTLRVPVVCVVRNVRASFRAGFVPSSASFALASDNFASWTTSARSLYRSGAPGTVSPALPLFTGKCLPFVHHTAHLRRPLARRMGALPAPNGSGWERPGGTQRPNNSVARPPPRRMPGACVSLRETPEFIEPEW